MNDHRISTLQIGNDWFGERQGGLNRFYSELLKHLPGAGVKVRGMVAGSSAVATETAGVVIGFASPKEPLLRRLLAARDAGQHILREDEISLVAVHFALYGFPLLDKLRRVPTVIHFHGPWSAEGDVERRSNLSSHVQKSIERVVYSCGRRFIVLSSAFRQIMLERFRVPEDQIHVVPGGIDLERFNATLSKREARIRLGWPTDRPIVLSVRRQMKRMGLENLIDAAVQVKQSVPDALILLAGAGPSATDLKRRVEDRGLENHVRLLGRVDDRDLPDCYRAADISVVPSQALEGFGMITLESLASGTPVLVTPVGGLPEVIQPFAPECIFSGTDSEAISDLIIEYLLGVRALPTAEACRQYATDNFSWSRIAQRTRHVYSEASH